MKYSVSVVIDKPRDQVVKAFDSVDNMYKWMEGLEKFEAISGTPGEVGAKSKLTFKMGKGNRKMEMIETITDKHLPDSFGGTYEMKGVLNIIENEFEIIDSNKTKYTTHQEFQMKGFMKIMAFLMPGMFKKQTLKHMTSFKNFVEKTDL